MIGLATYITEIRIMLLFGHSLDVNTVVKNDNKRIILRYFTKNSVQVQKVLGVKCPERCKCVFA